MTTIEVEDVSAIKKKVTFEVPETRVQDMIDQEYRELKKTVQIKGFRRGKVPLNILRSYFKDKVVADTARKIIEETLEPGLDEKNIKPVSVAKIDPETLEVGKPFKYTAEIDVTPQLEVKDFKGLKLTRTVKKITDEEIQERLEGLRERHARLSPVPEDRELREGDHIVVDVVAEAEGETIAALTVNDYHMELGRDFYLPDFDTKLFGLKTGETREVTLNLPEDFPRKNIAGKEGKFTVTVTEAKERILPDLDDDFAKDLGKFETIDQLKEEIAKDIQQLWENQTEMETRRQIVDQLLEKNEFEVPETLVEQRIDQMLSNSLQRLAAQGIDPKRLPMPTQSQRDQFRPEALKAVKAGVLMAAVGSQEGITVSDEQVEKAVREKAELFDMAPDYFKERLEEAGNMEDFREGLLEDQVYKFVEANAEITEQEPPVQETSEEEPSEKE
jgi:trigger factor